MRDDALNYRQLFLDEVPLVDVRAPVEFARGAFPGAVNLPLMLDSEREQVGICYKQKGQQAAIEMGHMLVHGDVKAQRVNAWKAFTQAHPEGYIYCFRGGLRSQIVQQWLAEAGADYPRVVGGYKALRRFLIDSLNDAIRECPLKLVAGLTGTGKTEVIAALDCSLDLEGHAHHRGSSFGRRAAGQPGQIDFENRLAIEALKVRAKGHQTLVLEDEGRMVGSCTIPIELFRAMQIAPLIWLEESFENRVERILQDYVTDMHAEYALMYPDQPEAAFAAFSEFLLGSLLRIRKRLGGDRYQSLDQVMRHALEVQQRSGEIHAHRDWIVSLLVHYYDPMYAYQRAGKEERVVFSGDKQAIIEYLRSCAMGSANEA